MEKINNLILSLGIHATHLGYRYLNYGLSLTLENEDNLLMITKSLYPQIAAHLHTTTSCVERNLRTVISNCWERGTRRRLPQISTYPLTERPSTSEFLDILYWYLKNH